MLRKKIASPVDQPEASGLQKVHCRHTQKIWWILNLYGRESASRLTECMIYWRLGQDTDPNGGDHTYDILKAGDKGCKPKWASRRYQTSLKPC